MVSLNQVPQEVKRFARTLPKFSDGRINYHHSDTAPVLNLFVLYKGKILLLKRSEKVRAYKNKWNIIGGYLDTPEPLRAKVYEELEEEIGVRQEDVESIKAVKPHKLVDEEIGLTWIVYPVLVNLKRKPEIKLSEEHTEFRWINPEELTSFDIVPGIDRALQRLLEN